MECGSSYDKCKPIYDRRAPTTRTTAFGNHHHIGFPKTKREMSDSLSTELDKADEPSERMRRESFELIRQFKREFAKLRPPQLKNEPQRGELSGVKLVRVSIDKEPAQPGETHWELLTHPLEPLLRREAPSN